jgi:iron complex outermembrane receptor protein
MKPSPSFRTQAMLGCLLFSLCSLVAYGQAERGTLTGRVGDAKAPLPGAGVQLEGTPYGGVTGADGRFTLGNLPAGTYTLSVTLLGFAPHRQNVAVTAGANADVEIVLAESVQNLQEVEIIGRRETTYKNDYSFAGTKTATALKDIPQSISVVTKELLDDRQAYRIGDVVKNVSGVNQYSFYNDLTMRGFRSQNVRLINGLRGGFGFFTQPVTVHLERVEVIKGPASALFGNTVPGGTMNLVTKKPLAEKRQSLSFTTGSFNTYRAAADFTGPMNETGTLLYRLNVGYENAQSFRDLQGNETFLVAPSVTFLPTPRTNVNVDLVFTHTNTRLDRGQPIFGATAGTDLNSTPVSLSLNAANDFYKIRDLSLNASLTHKFTDWLSFNASYLKYAWSEDLLEHRNARNFAVDSAGSQLPNLVQMQVFQRVQKTFTDNLTTYLVGNLATGPVQHKLLLGYDHIGQIRPQGGAQNTARGFRNAANTGVIATYRPADKRRYLLDAAGNPVPNVPHFDITQRQYLIGNVSDYFFDRTTLEPTWYYSNGMYLQDQLTYGKLQLLLGLRQEFYTDVEGYGTGQARKVEQRALLPRVGLVYGLTKHVNLYGTYVEGYQPQGVSSQTNPNVGGPFDPLVSNMVEAGAKSEFGNGRFSANLALYQIVQNNVLVPAGDAQNPELLRQRGQERARGVEVDAVGRLLPNLSINLNYAYNEAIITEGNENEVGQVKENAPFTQGGAWAKYTFDGTVLDGVGFGLGASYVGKRWPSLTRGFSLPAYTLFDAAVYYGFSKFKLSLNVQNLGNTTYWVGGYDYLALFPGAPRNFLVNVAYTF